jgi:hypothetical protein
MARAESVASDKTGAFTFLEVLIALAILTGLAGVLFTSHATLIRAHGAIRSLEESRFIMAQVAVRRWLGAAPDEIVEEGQEGWLLSYEPVEMDDGTNQTVWLEWIVSPTNRPSQSTAFYLKAGA